ncbi:hypothetical protein CHELA1G11_11451 [Hyphomicrobiales bacterium]|nr:hypothetical protein CHELA1G11_11451 [Hyphomicrobiales bacterium]
MCPPGGGHEGEVGNQLLRGHIGGHERRCLAAARCEGSVVISHAIGPVGLGVAQEDKPAHGATLRRIAARGKILSARRTSPKAPGQSNRAGTAMRNPLLRLILSMYRHSGACDRRIGS